MGKTIYCLCIVEGVLSLVFGAVFIALYSEDIGVGGWAIAVAFAFWLVAVIALTESTYARKRKPPIGLSIALVVVGNVFGRIAGIMALAMSADYEPYSKVTEFRPSTERPPYDCPQDGS